MGSEREEYHFYKHSRPAWNALSNAVSDVLHLGGVEEIMAHLDKQGFEIVKKQSVNSPDRLDLPCDSRLVETR